MSILDDIKKESLKLRTARSHLAPFSVFLISEIQKIGKKQNRETTEAETIQVLKKTLATTEENILVLEDSLDLENKDNITTAGIIAVQKLIDEAEFVRDFIPKMVDKETVKNFLDDMFGGSTPNKGQVMKALKDKFGAYVDMKEAQVLYAELYT